MEWLPSLSRLIGGERLLESARGRVRGGEYGRRRGDLVRERDLEREYRLGGGERE